MISVKNVIYIGLLFTVCLVLLILILALIFSILRRKEIAKAESVIISKESELKMREENWQFAKDQFKKEVELFNEEVKSFYNRVDNYRNRLARKMPKGFEGFLTQIESELPGMREKIIDQRELIHYTSKFYEEVSSLYRFIGETETLSFDGMKPYSFGEFLRELEQEKPGITNELFREIKVTGNTISAKL